jgi:protein TonB
MGYQALLFCPDEKTARVVTQVLSELDFTVIPCTEPFAAVKKLMGEHFDAVVVDCDNEQNATLLFKSARNTANNQSSLAVAVVEGQAGVAKAFRIGANLVLTKPINVEQAKGTLRVARGLLRKGEAAKPAATAADAAVKPATPAPVKPAPQAPIPSVTIARPAAPIAPSVTAAAASVPTEKPAPRPRIVVAAPTRITETDTKPVEAVSEVSSAPVTQSAAPTSSAGFGTSAASAPAPAREPKPAASTEDKPSMVIAEPESPVEKSAAGATSSSEEISAPAPAPAPLFTFGGHVSSGTESAGGGSKKTLLAVAAVVLIAAGGYAAWTLWLHPNGSATVPAHMAAQPVTTPAAVPQVAPSAPSAAISTAQPATTSPAQSSTADSAAAPQPTGSAKTSSDSDTQPAVSVESAPAHPSKVSAGANSSKPPASAPAASKVPATTAAAAAPIVIKNGASQPVAAPDAPAPSMTDIAPADNSGALNLMGGQSAAPAPVLERLNVSQGVSRGLLVKQTQPTYPPSAIRMHVEGAVELSATISKEGDISAVKVLSGDPQLAGAAADAVMRWKYKPYLLNGEPVEIQTQITVNFKLPN